MGEGRIFYSGTVISWQLVKSRDDNRRGSRSFLHTNRWTDIHFKISEFRVSRSEIRALHSYLLRMHPICASTSFMSLRSLIKTRNSPRIILLGEIWRNGCDVKLQPHCIHINMWTVQLERGVRRYAACLSHAAMYLLCVLSGVPEIRNSTILFKGYRSTSRNGVP